MNVFRFLSRLIVMPHRLPLARFRTSRLRLLLGILICVPLLLSCSQWRERIHPDFVQTFIDANRHGDDSAATVVFDPVLRVLAVGRESGRLELWDTRQAGARLMREAHGARTQYIAFGREDGIVLSSSAFSDSPLDPRSGLGTKIWDVRSGELLHALTDMWAPGPVAASPVQGLYLIADASKLRLYDHARRSFVGAPLQMELGVQVTAVTADPVSGLIAVGTSRGDLLLMTLDMTDAAPRLAVLRQASPHGQQVRSDILALMLLDGGRRLVSVGWVPEDRRTGPQQAEVVAWDSATLARQRTLPFSLTTVNWASSTAGEPWLVLAGTDSRLGKVELVDLRNGVAWRYRANTTHPRAVLLPEIRDGLILQAGRATRIHYLNEETTWREKEERSQTSVREEEINP